MFRGSFLSSNYVLVKNMSILAILALIGGSLYIIWPRTSSYTENTTLLDDPLSPRPTEVLPVTETSSWNVGDTTPWALPIPTPPDQTPPTSGVVSIATGASLDPQVADIKLPEGMDPTSTEAVAYIAQAKKDSLASSPNTPPVNKPAPTPPAPSTPTPIKETVKKEVEPDGTCGDVKRDTKLIKTQYQYSIEEGKWVRPSKNGYDSCQYTDSLAVITPEKRIIIEQSRPEAEITSYTITPSGEHITYNVTTPETTSIAVFDVVKQRRIDEALVSGFAYGFDNEERYFFSCSQKELGTGTIKIYDLDTDDKKFLFPENGDASTVTSIWVESCSQLDAGTNSFSYSLRNTSTNEVKDYIYSFKDGSLK